MIRTITLALEEKKTAPRYVPLIDNFVTSTFYSITKCKVGRKTISGVTNVTIERDTGLGEYGHFQDSNTPSKITLTLETHKETRVFDVTSINPTNYDGKLKIVVNVKREVLE